MSTWRSRLRARSHNSYFLKKLALMITGGSFLLSLLIIAMAPDDRVHSSTDPQEQLLRDHWQKLNHAEAPMPYEMVQWIDNATEEMVLFSTLLEIKLTTPEDYAANGLLLNYPVRDLLARHSSDEKVRQLWNDYILAQLSREPAALTAVAAKGEEKPPLLTANFIQACLLKERSPEDALAALMREESFHPGSALVRRWAFHEATRLNQAWALKEAAANPQWWDAMDVGLRQQAAVIIGDAGLLWKSLLDFRPFENASPVALLIALLAAAIWYIILVMHGVRGRWRWLAPLLPLAAGVLSVLPVYPITTWQEVALKMTDTNTFPQGLWYQIAGVGVREELCKLLFAALFMPWLLARRIPGAALMVGAFVGLGFALEENINYYVRYEGGIALARFFTANFLHAAMTGITTHALYQLLRSRFGTADRFLVSVLGIMVVHGSYNFASLGGVGMEGLDILSMILLAMTAWHFLDLVDQECVRAPQWISPAAVFIVGTAVLMAAIFLSIAFRGQDRQTLAAAATACIGVFPVAFIYWRRLGG